MKSYEPIFKSHIEHSSESIGSNFPSIANLRTNFEKQKSPKTLDLEKESTSISDLANPSYSDDKKLALKLTFKNLETFMKVNFP